MTEGDLYSQFYDNCTQDLDKMFDRIKEIDEIEAKKGHLNRNLFIERKKLFAEINRIYGEMDFFDARKQSKKTDFEVII